MHTNFLSTLRTAENILKLIYRLKAHDVWNFNMLCYIEQAKKSWILTWSCFACWNLQRHLKNSFFLAELPIFLGTICTPQKDVIKVDIAPKIRKHNLKLKLYCTILDFEELILLFLKATIWNSNKTMTQSLENLLSLMLLFLISMPTTNLTWVSQISS